VLSVLTVNIGAASLERARLQLDWLASRPEEVLVITETSAGPGTAWLLDHFRRAGFAVIKTPDTDGERGSALVSRVRVARDLTAEFAAVSVPCRVSAAVLGTEPAISVLGVYVPSRDRSADKTERKQRFIRTLVEECDKLPWDLREHLERRSSSGSFWTWRRFEVAGCARPCSWGVSFCGQGRKCDASWCVAAAGGAFGRGAGGDQGGAAGAAVRIFTTASPRDV
jgi:hypothetical protein